MTLTLICSYIGSSFNVVAFFMRVPLRLRQLALVSNVLLVGFAWEAHVWGLFASNAILLPLNAWRLRELLVTRRAVRTALATTDLSWEWLRPFMTRRHFAAGATIFHKGDLADEIYFVLEGTVHFAEIGVDVGIGALFGEIAMFSPERRRTASASARTDATMLTITSDQLIELYEKNPQFGIYIVRTITARLLADIAALEATDRVSSEAQSGAIAP